MDFAGIRVQDLVTGSPKHSGMSRPFPPNTSGTHAQLSESELREAAQAALVNEEWAAAHELWRRLACTVPQNSHYRAELGFARASELLAAGETARAGEELKRVLRIEPDHPGATAALKGRWRNNPISWLLRR